MTVLTRLTPPSPLVLRSAMKNEMPQLVPAQTGEGQQTRLHIVVPCFNEEEVLPETAGRLTEVMERLMLDGRIAPTSRICFVDDGSRDGTWRLIEDQARANSYVTGVKLSRNQGHQNALLAGLFTVDADAVISVDADLQDDINVIPEMLAQHSRGVEVVYGVRRDRSSDSLFKRGTAETFYRLFRFLGAESVANHADFRLMSRNAIDALKEFREVNLFLRGLVPLIGFRSAIVYYTRSERFAGVSKYPVRKMLALALDALTSFTVVPLRIISILGFLVFGLSALMGVWALGIRIFTNLAVPGWTSTILPIYLLGGIQLLCIGVIGNTWARSTRRPRDVHATSSRRRSSARGRPALLPARVRCRDCRSCREERQGALDCRNKAFSARPVARLQRHAADDGHVKIRERAGVGAAWHVAIFDATLDPRLHAGAGFGSPPGECGLQLGGCAAGRGSRHDHHAATGMSRAAQRFGHVGEQRRHGIARADLLAVGA